MPTVVTDLPEKAEPPRKRWTRAEYERVSLDGEHLELVEGELISKMGKKRPHSNTLMLLRDWLLSIFGGRLVQTEVPIDVASEDNPTSEPEPDLIVTRQDGLYYSDWNPGSPDLRLIVEVADTTVGFDISTKARLYARAGIVEYWVVDIPGRRIIVHRDPRNGAYSDVVAYGEDELVSPLAAPRSTLRVRDVLP